MDMQDIALERISLGALIIALGMLVDNAIVVVDGMLVVLKRARKPKTAPSLWSNKRACPYWGHRGGHHGLCRHRYLTDSTGEFCASLFQ